MLKGATAHVNRNKCTECGLVNPDAEATCRRCHATLHRDGLSEDAAPVESAKKRSLGKRVLWILGTASALFFACYMSMLVTSKRTRTLTAGRSWRTRLPFWNRKAFRSQAFVLGHLVKYRDTDNWWNRSVGHHDAYAATNFPFEVVTLYPEFFDAAVDDTERAAILLHESYHLFGSGEVAALEGVWHDKQQLSWTADRYSQTKVWRNTRDSTMTLLPRLFECGPDGHSDCVR